MRSQFEDGQKNGVVDLSLIDESVFANICILSKSDNNLISGKAPSEYKKMMPKDTSQIELTNFLPPETWSDDYSAFLHARTKLLRGYAERLI